MNGSEHADARLSPPNRPLVKFEWLPLEALETADVSPIAVTNDERNCLILFGSDQNRTQEADGSIPFSSTIIEEFGVGTQLERLNENSDALN